jgi:hypothetical protein
VLGVTRDGATAWALAKATLIERVTAAEAIADHLFEKQTPRALLAQAQPAAPPLLSAITNPRRTKKRNCFVANAGENSAGGVEMSVQCHQGTPRARAKRSIVIFQHQDVLSLL